MKRLLVITLLTVSPVLLFAIDVQRTTPTTIFSRTLIGGPDYHQFSYSFAPTIIKEQGNTDSWFCGSVNVHVPPDGGSDRLFFVRNWGLEEVTLCPAWQNESDPSRSPLCASLYRVAQRSEQPKDDNNLICDPGVIRVAGQYWMYYTADHSWDQDLDPITGQPKPGDYNQVFLARSFDGRNWSKYPNNAGPAQPIIPISVPSVWGTGEPSLVFKDGVFVMYYGEGRNYNTNFDPDWHGIYRTTSTDGINFSGRDRVFRQDLGIPFAYEGGGGVEVKYIPGWNLWFMVTPTYSKQDLTWNISRDGIHWLPWDGSFGHQTRLINLPRRFAIGAALEANALGHIGDGTLASSQQVKVVFTASDSQYIRGCADGRTHLGEACFPDYDNPQPPDEPPGFWKWTFDATDLTLTPQWLYGWLDEVTAQKFATGWAYDRDTGVNDAAVNGGSSFPLGHDTWVRPIAINTVTSQRYEGAWQSAQLFRGDLVSAGQAPDAYHGFSIDLQTQGFPPGTYTIKVEGGEFPTGMGATELLGQAQVTLTSSSTPNSARADFSADGNADLVWRNYATGGNAYWAIVSDHVIFPPS